MLSFSECAYCFFMNFGCCKVIGRRTERRGRDLLLRSEFRGWGLSVSVDRWGWVRCCSILFVLTGSYYLPFLHILKLGRLCCCFWQKLHSEGVRRRNLRRHHPYLQRGSHGLRNHQQSTFARTN